MATEEEIALLIKKFNEFRPGDFFKNFDHRNAGIGCVVRYLAERGEPASAGEISDFMDVSTARVAVLLRKVEEKGFIVRQSDPKDARKTLVSLSPSGMETYNKAKADYLRLVSALIDRIGLERLKDFIDVSAEIKEIAAKEFQNFGTAPQAAKSQGVDKQ